MKAGSSAGAVVIGCAMALAVGCAASPHVIVSTAGAVDRVELEPLLAAHPLGPAQNILAVPLGRTEAMSYHLVQIRDRETPHQHATHDLSVTLLRGEGVLHVGGTAQTMRAGDAAVVPRGTPHYFVNTASSPSVSLATFAPPYDGTDQVPVAAAP